jgi:formylglycine-generating enzyme required for sulfatase activity
MLVIAICAVILLRWLAIERHRQAQIDAVWAPAPEGMVLVPAGYFLMGSDSPDADADVPRLQRVFLPAFYIGQHEVANAEFREVFPGHEFPEGEEEMPVTAVLRPEALEYCARRGGYLPSAAEWEKAARGTDGRQWPWGNDFRPECANIGRLDADARAQLEARGIECGVRGPRVKVRVGSYPCGASPYGALDMAGNVWEWVSDIYTDPRPPLELRWEPQPRGLIRGGAYGYGPDAARTWFQAFESPDATCNDVGFRMAMRARASSGDPGG